MPTTARNVFNKKKIVMAVPKSSIWEVQRLICFMSGKSLILEKVGDWHAYNIISLLFLLILLCKLSKVLQRHLKCLILSLEAPWEAYFLSIAQIKIIKVLNAFFRTNYVDVFQWHCHHGTDLLFDLLGFLLSVQIPFKV